MVSQKVIIESATLEGIISGVEIGIQKFITKNSISVAAVKSFRFLNKGGLMSKTASNSIKPLLLTLVTVSVLLMTVVEGMTAVSVSPTALNLGATSDGFLTNWSGYSGQVNVSVYYDNGNPTTPTRLCDAIINTSGASGQATLYTNGACGSGWSARSDYRVGIELRTAPYTKYYSNYFTVYQKPDLVAERIWLSSISTPGIELTDPKVGDLVYINFQFSVVSATTYEPISIKGYLDGSPVYTSTYSPPINAITYYPSTQTYSYYWTVTEGSHTIRELLSNVVYGLRRRSVVQQVHPQISLQ
ncbi:MAG: hypothetical protein HY892_08155 [Deltaproteobacteria bacterium]|nr:hypothetical protein [Deltaproteobacteria bacterium]